jgi:hypothetical protein
VLLADHFVDIAGPQAFGERNIGTGFFKHDVLGIISAFPDAVRGKAACCRMSAKPAREGAGNIPHYDSDGVRTMAARRGGTTRAAARAGSSTMRSAAAHTTAA